MRALAFAMQFATHCVVIGVQLLVVLKFVQRCNVSVRVHAAIAARSERARLCVLSAVLNGMCFQHLLHCIAQARLPKQREC
jgi:hypothetical protein